jgi:type IV pilus assembly protein PilE
MSDLGYGGATFTSPEGFYTIRFNGVPTASSYSIEAVPAGAQVSDAGCAAGESCCGTYRLNNRGEKSVTGATMAADRCW